MKKAKKGSYGYIRWEKLRRLLTTLLMLALPLAFFTVGMILNKGDRKSIYTVIAIVGCLPACKSMVSMIMMWMQKPMAKDHYEAISGRSKSLEMVYELYITSYEKSIMLEAAAICGEEVACFGAGIQDGKDIQQMEAHIQKLLRANGYKTHVKIFTDLKHYLERLDSLNAHYNELEQSANERFKPDERYPDLSRDEMVKHNLMALAL